MLLTASQSTHISFPCDTRSKSTKWMGICRFEIKNFLLFHSSLTVLWRFWWFACVSTKDDSLNELPLAKELDVTATSLINLSIIIVFCFHFILKVEVKNEQILKSLAVKSSDFWKKRWIRRQLIKPSNWIKKNEMLLFQNTHSALN